jgi:hypothetical protein
VPISYIDRALSQAELARLGAGFRFRSSSYDHIQQVMAVPPEAGGGWVHVDSGMCRLLLMVWLHGWRTFASCEAAGGGSAQIVFEYEHDAVDFVVAADFPGRVSIKVPDAHGWPRRNVRLDTYFPSELIHRASSALHQLLCADGVLTGPGPSTFGGTGR